MKSRNPSTGKVQEVPDVTIEHDSNTSFQPYTVTSHHHWLPSRRETYAFEIFKTLLASELWMTSEHEEVVLRAIAAADMFIERMEQAGPTR